ncbi:MAG: hypothetical protein IJ705_02365 [Oscillospiraceae bacterium]|nr:hypothetical protein [Oscillospiraceae bacterium]
MKENKIFRKESVERISSPEQMTDYLRVTTPAVWMVLLAVVALLAGIVAWSVLGTMETRILGEAMVQDGVVYVMPNAGEDARGVSAGMTLRVGGAEGTVTGMGYTNDGALLIRGAAEVADGMYSAEIVTETVHAISFLLH